MKADHNWNVLRIMRFYNRIGKPFNAGVYIHFMTPHDGTPSTKQRRPEISDVQVIIRRYLKNKWCVRDGENLVITPKGTKAIMEYDRERFAKEKENKIEASIKGGNKRVSLTESRRGNGTFA